MKRKYAESIELEGVPNLYKVSSELYRSAQPTEEGFENLDKLGIKTVVSLRAFHDDINLIVDTDLKYERICMQTWYPEVEDAIKFLRIVSDPKRTPVLVHCLHGADRAGTMSALYRIVIEGWTKEEAIEEMTEGGFGFHWIWENLTDWIEELHINKIKKELEKSCNT